MMTYFKKDDFERGMCQINSIELLEEMKASCARMAPLRHRGGKDGLGDCRRLGVSRLCRTNAGQVDWYAPDPQGCHRTAGIFSAGCGRVTVCGRLPQEEDARVVQGIAKGQVMRRMTRFMEDKNRGISMTLVCGDGGDQFYLRKIFRYGTENLSERLQGE